MIRSAILLALAATTASATLAAAPSSPLSTVAERSGFQNTGRYDEVVALWEEATGRDAGDMRWFVALAVWKLAILLEANYHRWLAGLSDDAFYEALDVGVPALLARARAVCGA